MDRSDAVAIVHQGADGVEVDGVALPPAVIASVLRRYQKNDAVNVLVKLQYSHTSGCWFFTWAGMLVGIEADGYMHT